MGRIAGRAWVGRNNRSDDPTLTAVVTFGDLTTETLVRTMDGDGDGMIMLQDFLLPRGKDSFWGFSDNGSGITKLTISSDRRHFNGWDDIGIVVGIPEPASIGLGILALLGLAFTRQRCNR